MFSRPSQYIVGSFRTRNCGILQLPHHNCKTMLVIFGTIAVLLAVFWSKPRKNIMFYLQYMLNQMRYAAMGPKELILDKIQASGNKTELPKKTGKVAIVTGGSRGIGVLVVKMLLQCDMEVIIACRNTEAGHKAIQHIRDEGIATGIGKVYKLDNSSFESIREFAKEIKKNYTKIHVLVNNAGVMFPPYSETEDGYEHQWGVNYLSHFLLTSLLLPLLKAAGTKEENSRIVNVSSVAHLLGCINFENINYKDYYIPGAAYAQSKMAQIMFTKTLEDHFRKNNDNIHVYAVHPGIVDTELFKGSITDKFKWFTSSVFKKPVDGATPIVFAAVDPRVENKGGIYISNCLEAEPHSLVKDKDVRERLFELSAKQAKLNDFYAGF